MRFADKKEVLAYLARATDYERHVPRPGGSLRRRYNLRRMRALLARTGHPERAVQWVHVAGTKGKGSVAHMLESILRAAGKRTGLYTSPHLVDLKERIRLDGRPIASAALAAAANRIASALDAVRPTFFEFMTAAAWHAFAEAGVETAVMEVGLGGRLDATNVGRPALAVITRIDYDHMETLGPTLADIAREKAGIIKPGVPLVLGEAEGPAWDAILAVARRRRAPLVPIEPAPAVESPLLGAHQRANASLAAAAARALGVGPAAIRRGRWRARVPGRIELVGRRPTAIIDVAHNPAATAALLETLWPLPARRRWLVFGASRDKDLETMLALAAPFFDALVFTAARHPRAAPPRRLARIAAARGGRVAGAREPSVAAWRWALRRAAPDDLVVAAGSFYVAGEILAALRGPR